MVLYTSYLGFFNRKDVQRKLRFPFKVDSFERVFVMRDRGNNEVAPDELPLEMAKRDDISWEKYSELYLNKLGTDLAKAWMRRVAERAKDHDVVLICFEKGAEHCHRTLLAKEIAKRFGIDYQGEFGEKLKEA